MKRTYLCALQIALLVPSSIFALGIRVVDQNAKATARADAFTATADNPSAIYYNPAGITQLEGHNFVLGTYVVSVESEHTDPSGAEFSTKDKVQLTPQFFYSYTPGELPVSFGLGFYTPYGLGLEWPDNATFRAMKGNITYLTVNPTVAWQIHPTFSLGAGVRFNHADAELTQTIFPGALFPPGGQNRFRGDGMAVGFNLGALWQPHEQHSFGVSYYSATEVDLEGDSRTSGADLAGVPSFTQPANAVFDFPQHIVVGYSFRPTPDWNIEFNVDWTDWETLDVVTVNQATGPAALPFNWRSSFIYEFGVTRNMPGNWQISAGYAFSENSVPEASFNPLVPDSDRHIFSVGVGGQCKRLTWDAAYQLGYGPERTISNNALAFPVGASANGRYQFTSHALSAAIGYMF